MHFVIVIKDGVDVHLYGPYDDLASACEYVRFRLESNGKKFTDEHVGSLIDMSVSLNEEEKICIRCPFLGVPVKCPT